MKLLFLAIVMCGLACRSSNGSPEHTVPESKSINFPENNGSTDEYHKYRIVTASDGHDYLRQRTDGYYIYFHYVDCTLCASRNKK